MSSGRLFLLASISISSLAGAQNATAQVQSTLTTSQPPSAEPAIAVPDVQNSKFQASGSINANGVMIRSGAGENYYPTARLDKGTPVTIVGIRFDWLKIVPPEGSFSYVSKAYVEKRGDGTVGRVTRPDLNVRAGSALQPVKTAIQTKLNEGDDVQIIGEADEYFKIKPPAGAFLYVNKQFVDAVQVIGQNPQATPAGNTTVAGGATTGTGSGGVTGATDTTGITSPGVTSTGNIATPGSTTQPAGTVASVTKAETDFAQLEEQFRTESTKPLDQQAVGTMLPGYEAVVKADGLPESLRRLADQRIVALKARQSTQAEYVVAKKRQAELEKQQLAMTAERQELEARVKEHERNVFSAVGTLRTSSLQQGAGVLFRVTDPANGRTLVYIRSSDPNLASKIGHFVGIRGPVGTDSALNIQVINSPTTVDEVAEADIAKIAAQIMPPSMISRAQTASSTEGK